MDKLTLKPEEVAAILGIGRNSVYSAIRRGQIPTIRIGKLKLVPKVALEKMLNDVVRKEEV